MIRITSLDKYESRQRRGARGKDGVLDGAVAGAVNTYEYMWRGSYEGYLAAVRRCQWRLRHVADGWYAMLNEAATVAKPLALSIEEGAADDAGRRATVSTVSADDVPERCQWRLHRHRRGARDTGAAVLLEVGR